MAGLKKGQINQVLFTLVDKTDGLTVESALTNSSLRLSATAKFYGLVHGGSVAVTSAALTKPLRTATGADNNTGVFRAVLTAAECVYDEMSLRIRHPSAATQHLVLDFVDYDDSDLMSYLVALSSLESDIHWQALRTYSRVLLGASLASDAQSMAQQTYSRVLLAASVVSDIQSYLVAMSGMLSDVQSQAVRTYSRVLLSASVISDVQSYLVAMSGMLSDVHSAATAGSSRALLVQSQASDIYSLLLGTSAMISDVQSYLVGMSGMVSDVHSLVAARTPAALTGAGNMKADVLAINGDTTAAAVLAILNGATVVYQGTATGAVTTTTLIDSGLTQADTDWWKGRIIIFTSVLTLQATDITAFDPATDKLTFTAVTNPPTGATYVII